MLCPDTAASLPCQPLPRSYAEADANAHCRAHSPHPKHSSVGWPRPGAAQMPTPWAVQWTGMAQLPQCMQCHLCKPHGPLWKEKCQQRHPNPLSNPFWSLLSWEEMAGGDLRRAAPAFHTPGQKLFCLSYFDTDLSNLY